jgi:microcystin-dependent protein
VPIHQGQGPGISQSYVIGERAGVEAVTLTQQQIPVHTHPMQASSESGQQPQPTNAFLAQTNPGFPYVAASQPVVSLNAASVAVVGGSQPHENMAPFLVVSFIISLFGVYPSQS